METFIFIYLVLAVVCWVVMVYNLPYERHTFDRIHTAGFSLVASVVWPISIFLWLLSWAVLAIQKIRYNKEA